MKTYNINNVENIKPNFYIKYLKKLISKLYYNMENKFGFLGKHNDTPIYLNMGKYGYCLYYDNGKLFSVPQCFQDNKFNLESAI